jgi:hypothetical protein
MPMKEHADAAARACSFYGLPEKQNLAGSTALRFVFETIGYPLRSASAPQ